MGTFQNIPYSFSVNFQNTCFVNNDMSYAFKNCTNFNSPIKIPNNTINMSGTFANCIRFNQPINIPSSVEKMSDTFANCISFNQPIYIPNNVVSIAGLISGTQNSNLRTPFNSKITFSSNGNLKYMGWAFANSCFNQSINIPEGVVDIEGIFQGCYNFNQPIIIPNSVVSMRWAFAGILNGVSYNNVVIRKSFFNSKISFSNNSQLKEMDSVFENSYFNQPINIPNSVVNMGWAFANSSFNQPINIPSSVEGISGIFSNSSFNQPINILSEKACLDYAFENSCFNQNFIFPNSIVKGDSVFENAKNLKANIVLPNYFEWSMNDAFKNCQNLLRAPIPETWNEIPSRIFYNCTRAIIHVPEGINKIGTDAFYRTAQVCYDGNYDTSNWGASRINQAIWSNYDRIEPTCTEEGILITRCAYCQLTKNYPISKLPHTYSSINRIEPTCTEEGYEIYSCINCNTIKKEIISTIPHKLVNNICTVCGKEIFYNKNYFTYEIVNNNARITNINYELWREDYGNIIYFPSELDGLPTEIVINN